MKKSLGVLLVLVLLAGLSTSVFAERFGTPGASLAKGQWSIGLEYNYIEEEVDLQTPQGWTLIQRGEEQAARNQLLVRVGYGLTDKLEAFVKMGGTSTVMEDALVDDFGAFNEEFEGDMEFTIAGGLALTILEEGNFKLGMNGSLMWFQTNDDTLAVWDFIPHYQAIDADIFKFEGALMASYQMGKITPYGGVCMCIHDGDARYRWLFPAAPTAVMADIDVDQEDWFGLVLGANCEIVENLTVGVELTHVMEGVGVSVGVNCAL